jgi:hypothetical protein
VTGGVEGKGRPRQRSESRVDRLVIECFFVVVASFFSVLFAPKFDGLSQAARDPGVTPSCVYISEHLARRGVPVMNIGRRASENFELELALSSYCKANSAWRPIPMKVSCSSFQ